MKSNCIEGLDGDRVANYLGKAEMKVVDQSLAFLINWSKSLKDTKAVCRCAQGIFSHLLFSAAAAPAASVDL